jgi:hypothetical protein
MWGPKVSVGLGDDNDELRDQLDRAFRSLHARRVGHGWGVGGSQEVEWWKYRLNFQTLVVEAETYVGLSLIGSRDAVQKVINRLDR